MRGSRRFEFDVTLGSIVSRLILALVHTELVETFQLSAPDFQSSHRLRIRNARERFRVDNCRKLELMELESLCMIDADAKLKPNVTDRERRRRWR